MASPLAAGFFSKGQDERLVVASANCAGRVEKSRQGGMAEWGRRRDEIFFSSCVSRPILF